MDFLSYLLIFTITPVLTAWFIKKTDPYLSEKFPLSKEDKQKIHYLLSDKNPNRAKYERYAIIEIFMIMIPLGILVIILPFLLPFVGLKNDDTLMLFRGGGLFIIFIPAFFLSVAIAAYVSHFVIKAIFKLLNPKEDPSVLYYTSRIMNASAAGFQINYDPRAGNFRFLLVCILLYPVALYMARSNVDTLSRTNFHSGGVIFSKDYKMEDIDLMLYPKDGKNRLEIKLRKENEILRDDEVKEGQISKLQDFIDSR